MWILTGLPEYARVSALMAYSDGDCLTGLETKCCLKSQVADQAVNGGLAMLALNFREDQFGAIAIVATAQTDLDLQEFPGLFQRHGVVPPSGEGHDSRSGM